MSCLGKFKERVECYECDPYMRKACIEWREAFKELRLAQNSITLAVDSLEQAARAIEEAIGRKDER